MINEYRPKLPNPDDYKSFVVFGLWYCGWCLADLCLFGHISYIANLFVSLFCAALSELSE